MFKKFFSKYQTEDLAGFAIGMIATVIYKFIVHAKWNLEDMFDNLITNYKVNELCPYGDGHTSEKIIEILNR